MAHGEKKRFSSSTFFLYRKRAHCFSHGQKLLSNSFLHILFYSLILEGESEKFVFLENKNIFEEKKIHSLSCLTGVYLRAKIETI